MLEEEAIQNESITSIPHDRDVKTKHYSDFLQYLDNYYCDTTSFDGAPDKRRRPTLLNINCCCTNTATIEQSYDILAITAAKFNLSSRSISLDTNEVNIQSSKRLAFQQQVFDKCHFFEVNYNDDPTLLLNNPHFMADQINECDIVFIYAATSDLLQTLLPLLSLLSSKKEGNRKFVTCLDHLPREVAVNPKHIYGTELCVYDGIAHQATNRQMDASILCPPPEPVDDELIDKEFARASIKHAMPRRV